MSIKYKFLNQQKLNMLASMRLVNNYKIIYFLSALFLLSSCGRQIKQNLTLEPIKLTAKGPYFEGPNSFQGKIGLDVIKFLQEKGFKKEQLKDIKIVKSSVNLDSLSIHIQDLTLQVVSEKESMQKVAFINPLPHGSNNIQLSVAQEQKDLASYFLEEGTLVLDANFLKEIDQNIFFTVSLELELSIKQ